MNVVRVLVPDGPFAFKSAMERPVAVGRIVARGATVVVARGVVAGVLSDGVHPRLCMTQQILWHFTEQ